jgi:hypothetical protein
MMRHSSRSFRLLWLALALALGRSSVPARAAAGADPVHLPAVHLADGAAPPTLDGVVNDEAWLEIEAYSSFTQTDPIEGAPASERTEVRILFDKTNLYIGVICFDSEPDKIIVNQSRRDADLIPVKVSYAFTTLASVQALVQYNNQASLLSSNIRVALLNRSGTGMFVVFNDRRDTTDFNPYETLGRSFIVKYTRLFDF